MFKLLVNAPSGKQEIVEVSESGGYFDASRVLWDEREDGPLPDITIGGMVRSGDSLTFDQARMDEHVAASAPPVPAQVTRRQARQALLLAGKLDLVEPAIAAIPDPTVRALALIEWQDSLMFERDRALVNTLGAALGLTSADIDQLFISAATL